MALEPIKYKQSSSTHRQQRRYRIYKVIFYSIVLAGWQLTTMSGMWPDNMFPSPYEVAEDLVYGVSDGSILYGTATSMARLLASLAIAIMGGVILGTLMAQREAINQTIGSLVLGLQSIPSIAWVPLGILWFGLTDIGIIFVASIGAVFAVTITTYTGIRSIETRYVEAGRCMGASGIKLAIMVLLPASWPFLISGFKQGWAYAWRGIIGAELLFSFLGLGFLLNVGRSLNDVSQVIAVMLLIMLIGLVVDGLVFRRLEDSVLSKWNPGSNTLKNK